MPYLCQDAQNLLPYRQLWYYDDGCYYRDVVRMQQMFPSSISIAGDAYVFQQDSAPVHRARQTVELLQRETFKFIAPDLRPPNRSQLNPTE